MSSLTHRFCETLISSCGIVQGDSLVIAVSGGPDSMALLHLFSGVQQRLGLELVAAWVDHGLRPLETKAEGNVVAAAAEKLHIPFIASQVDVSSFSRENHLSIEHAARDLRYKTLRTILSDRQAQYIAVAHTADDQSEEILIRLLRGSGRKGVSGMCMRSGELVRPLLLTEKQVLLDWLDEQKIPFCQDSSNTDLKFIRNRVRHQLLPFLEDNFDKRVRQSLRKTADSLAMDESLLAELTDAAFARVVKTVSDQKERQKAQLARQPFCDLHSALQRRVVEQLLWVLGARASYAHIMAVCSAAATGRNKSELHLSRGLRVGVFREYLEFSYPVGLAPWRGRLFE
jgi:tRNA(Ile)-lysidine synthase